MSKRWFIVAVGAFLLSLTASSQRTYKTSSVLSSGNWYKLAIKSAGVYKIDIPFLNSLGVATVNLASNSIRLFGNGGQMLVEANAGPWTDDLRKTPLWSWMGAMAY